MQKYVVCRIQFCLIFLSCFDDSGRLDRSKKVVLLKKSIGKVTKIEKSFLGIFKRLETSQNGQLSGAQFCLE